MPAYIIGRVHVTDWSRYAEYMKASPGVIAQFGGRFLARGGEVVTLEGPQETDRVVLIEFPTLEAAKQFYHSEEYRQIKALREGAASAQFLVMEGLAATEFFAGRSSPALFSRAINKVPDQARPDTALDRTTLARQRRKPRRRR